VYCDEKAREKGGNRAVMMMMMMMKGLDLGLDDGKIEEAVKLDMQCCTDDEMEMRKVRLSKAMLGNVFPRQII
jgi:hypothetical protein